MWKNVFIRKIKLISRFMTSQLGKQTVTVNILPSISRSKDNQTMRYGLLIEYNMTNTFLEKSYTKMVEELFPDSSLKSKN